MHKFKILFLNTIYKELHSKTLLIVSIFTLIFLFTFNYLLEFAIDYNPEIANLLSNKLAIFYNIIGTWSGLWAAFFGINCVKSDFEYNVINQLLALPIKKSTYIFARLLGSWFIVCMYYFLSLVLALILFSIASTNFTIDYSIFAALLTSSFSLLAIIAISTLISIYFNKVITFIFMLGILIVISIVNNIFSNMNINDIINSFSLFKAAGILVHISLPHIGNINLLANSVLSGSELNFSWITEIPHYVLTMTGTIYLTIFSLKLDINK